MKPPAFYRRLLLLLPRHMRRNYGDEMSALFAERLEEHPGPFLWVNEAASLAAAGFRARIWDNLKLDLRAAFRLYAKQPSFAILAVLLLAVGIGGATAMYSMLEAWVLDPLPYRDGARLMYLQSLNLKKGWYTNVSAGDFEDWQRDSSFEGMSAWSQWTFHFTNGDRPERAAAMRVSANFLRLLGAAPLYGRDFLDEEDRPGAHRAVLLAYAFAQSRFPGDLSTLPGRTVELDNEKAVVAGVLPEKFQFPFGKFEFLTPLALSSAARADRNNHWLRVMARRKSDISAARAQESLADLARSLEKSYPEADRGMGVYTSSLAEEIGRHQGNEIVVVCFALTLFVLLVVCANIAGLMLAKSVERQKEVAVRFAMGASRGRVIRQLLTEHVLLFIAGAAGSIAIAKGITTWIGNSIPYENRVYLRDMAQIPVDWRALVFAFLVAVGFALIFGLAPALECSSLDLNAVLKEGSGRGSPSRRGRWIRDGLVGMEIALATALLIATALLGRSLGGLLAAQPGFRADGLLSVNVALPPKLYEDLPRAGRTLESVGDRIGALPGVQKSAAVEHIPFGETGSTRRFWIEGRPDPQPGEVPTAGYTSVSPGYFAVMEIPLLAGRDFETSDEASRPRVAVISEVMAERYWPKENPLGQHLRIGSKESEPVEIVGVVKPIQRFALDTRPENQMYVAMRQFPTRRANFVVRGAGDGSDDAVRLGSAIRAQISAIDGNIPMPDMVSVQHLIDVTFTPHQIVTEMVSAFSLLTMVLAATGLYAMVARSVTQRSREIGIRMALGASAGTIVGGVLRRGIGVTVIGAALGLAFAALTTQWLRQVLFNVSPRDPLTFAGVAGILMFVAMSACYVPARRAASTDPAAALRHE